MVSKSLFSNLGASINNLKLGRQQTYKSWFGQAMTDINVKDHGHLQGFTDYHYCFPSTNIVWTIVGSIFLLVNIIAYIPQPFEIIQKRTSYGLACLTVFGQTIMHFFILMNLISLNGFDFVGLLQYPLSQTIARYVTFFMLFSQWFQFVFVVYLLLHFDDRSNQSRKDPSVARKSWRNAILVGAGYLLADTALVVIWVILGMTQGFQSVVMIDFGEVYGTVGLVLDFIQFLPQLWEIIKLKGPGSLSVLMLEIQCPTDFICAFFMWLGQGDHWTTWGSTFLDSASEIAQLALIFGFYWRNRKLQKKLQAEKSESDHLFASIGIVPLPLEVPSDNLNRGNIKFVDDATL